MRFIRAILFSFPLLFPHFSRAELNYSYLDHWDHELKDVVAVGDYVYNIHGSGAFVYDVSGAPYRVGAIDFGQSDPSLSLHNVDTDGSYLYFADGRILIYDLSTPAQPQQLCTFENQQHENDYQGLVSVGNILYAVGDYFDSINISARSNPSVIDDYNDVINGVDIAISGDYAFIACQEVDGQGFDGLRIFNISNPSVPQEISTAIATSQPYSIDVSGDYVYLGYDNGFDVIDVSNSASPAFVTTVYSSANDDQRNDLEITGDVLVVSGWRVELFDISDPTTPSSLSAISRYFVTGTYAVGDTLYIADLSIYDISNPASPSYLFVEISSTEQVGALGNGCLIRAGSGSGLEIYDVSNPVDIKLASVFDVPGNYIYAQSFDFQDDILYLTFSSAGLYMLDISDPYDPQLIHHIDRTTYGALVNGDFLYVSHSGALCVYDISTGIPQLIGDADAINASSNTMALFGSNYLLMGNDNQYLFVHDISNPVYPRIVDDYPVGPGPKDIAVSGDYAFVSMEFNTKSVVSMVYLNNPLAIYTRNQITPTKLDDGDIQLVGDYLYLNSQSNVDPDDLVVYNVADPLSPSLLGNIDLAHEIAAEPGFVYCFRGIDFSASNTGSIYSYAVELPGIEPRTATLQLAIEAPDLVASSNGKWYSQSIETYDGYDAARVDNLSANDSSALITNITTDEPSIVSFQWKFTGEVLGDQFIFFVNEVAQGSFTSYSNQWNECTVALPAGEHDLAWVYYTLGDASGDDGLLVDQLSITPIDTFYTVTFDLGSYGTRTGGGELTQSVAEGLPPVTPTFSVSSGWAFTEWSPVIPGSITADFSTTAQYASFYSYEIWGATFPPEATESEKLPTANYDGDAFTNEAEYYWVLDPATPNYTATTQSIFEDQPGIFYLKTDFKLRSNDPSIAYSVEVGTDLTNLTPISLTFDGDQWDSTGHGDTEFGIVTQTELTEGVWQIRVTYRFPSTTAFTRLLATPKTP